MTHKVFIGIGSNFNRQKNISAGLEALEKTFGLLQLSSYYETAPINAAGNNIKAQNYYNLVAGLNTDLSPQQIIVRLKKIEQQAGQRNKNSCPLDLDLLLYDDLVRHETDLDIPRRDIIDYAYVAVPLAELIADQRHPETGRSYREHTQSKQILCQNIHKIDPQMGEN